MGRRRLMSSCDDELDAGCAKVGGSQGFQAWVDDYALNGQRIGCG